MNRWVTCAALCAGLCPGWAQTLQITAGLAVTGRAPASSTLLRVGPLVPSGLMRELSSPLDRAAGSGVFGERTGFTVDSSLTRPAGFVCAPGAIGVFGQPRDGGSVECGVFLNSAPRFPWRAAGALWFAQPSTSGFGDSWYLDTAPFPGGPLAGAGGRLGLGVAGLEAGLTLGLSAGSVAPPGWLAEVEGLVSAGRLEAAFLLGACSRGYRAPAGTAAGTAWRASGLLRLSGADSAAQLRTTVDGGRPGFAPGPFVPMRRDLALQVDRSFTLGDRSETVAVRLTADKRISFDTQGAATEESSCAGRLTVSAGPAEASLSLSWSPDSGVTAAGRVQLDIVKWMSVEVDAAWSDHSQACTVTVECAVKTGEAR